jgi:translation elongation factor EF-Ts
MMLTPVKKSASSGSLRVVTQIIESHPETTHSGPYVSLLSKGLQMPNLSKAQNRFMQAAASNPEMAKKLGIPQQVAKEFVKETKSMKGKPERVKKKA